MEFIAVIITRFSTVSVGPVTEKCFLCPDLHVSGLRTEGVSVDSCPPLIAMTSASLSTTNQYPESPCNADTRWAMMTWHRAPSGKTLLFRGWLSLTLVWGKLLGPWCLFLLRWKAVEAHFSATSEIFNTFSLNPPLILKCSVWHYFHVYRGRICFWSVLLVIHFILAMAQRQFQLWKWKVWKWKSLSVRLFVTPWTTVHGILQARILEWIAFPFSKGSS